MARYCRFAYLTLAVTGVVVGVFGLALSVHAFSVWSIALFVAAVVLEQVVRPSSSREASKPVRMASTDVPEKAVTESPAAGRTAERPARQPDGHPVENETPHADPDLDSRVPNVAVEPPPLPRAPDSVEPSEVIEAFARAGAAGGEVLAAHLWLEDESTATLRLIAASGKMQPLGDPQPLAGTCLGRALATGVVAHCREQLHSTPDSERIVWRYAVPLSTGDARGVAALDIAAESPQREALGRVAAAFRSVLTGAVAVHVAREQTRSSQALLDATAELSRLIDPDAVVDALLRRAMTLSSAQTGSVMLLGDDGRLVIALSEGLPDDVPLVTSVGEGEGIAGWVLATSEPVVVEDLECKGPRSRRHGVRSAVSVPIADDDGLLGVLNVGNRTFRARFSSSHRDSLETLGRLGALALRNARALETSRDLYFDTLKALAVALETKDPYSQGATDRVVDLTTAIADALGMPDAERTSLRIASLLHDVGMSAAGDIVAVSDRPLSTVEWGMVKVHPLIAADVLEQAPALRGAVPIVYHHHERFDGDGYVVGLSAQTIPLGARVLAVADAYVAMTSDRPYRPAMTAEAALREIRSNAGTQFDPDVVTVLEELVAGQNRRAVAE